MAENPGELQFDRAEAAAGETGTSCAACKQPIHDVYYSAGSLLVCEACRGQLVGAMSGGSGAIRFLRAALAGLGAGAVGAGIYFAVLALSGYEVGLVAIIVGLLVGSAVRWGCQGRGGWLYQGLAIFLTYSAIVSTYVPYIIQAIRESKPPAGQSTTASMPAAEDEESAEDEPRGAGADAEDGRDFEHLSGGEKFLSLALAVGIIFALAYATPFLTGAQNIIGLLIIGIALYEAWKLNRRTTLSISGPFHLGAAAAPPAPGGGVG